MKGQAHTLVVAAATSVTLNNVYEAFHRPPACPKDFQSVDYTRSVLGCMRR